MSLQVADTCRISYHMSYGYYYCYRKSFWGNSVRKIILYDDIIPKSKAKRNFRVKVKVPLYRNQSIHLIRKSPDWFLHN